MGTHTGCGCMTNRTGALIFAWIEVIFVIPLVLGAAVVLIMGLTSIPGECPHTNYREIESMVNSMEFYMKENHCIPDYYHSYFTAGGFGALAACALYLLAPCCVIKGINKKRPSFLIPFIIVGILKKIIIFGWMLTFLALCPPAALLPLIVFLYELWKTIVVSCHYNYLSEEPAIAHELLLSKGENAYI